MKYPSVTSNVPSEVGFIWHEYSHSSFLRHRFFFSWYNFFHILMFFCLTFKTIYGQAWWLTPVISTLERLRKNDCHQFKVRLGYSVRLVSKKKKKQSQRDGSGYSSRE